MDATSGQQIQPWAAGVMVMLVLNFWCFQKDLVVTLFLPSFAVAAQAGGISSTSTSLLHTALRTHS
jgi:hypothetical protein